MSLGIAHQRAQGTRPGVALPLLLLVASVIAAAVVRGALAADELDSQGRDPHITELSDETFDAVVFPDGAASKPFFIFFYAPWCGHCKSTKPLFRDASSQNLYDLQEDQRGKTAAFAMLDATVHTAAAKRFHVRSFPTFVYTIRGRAYKYDSGRGVNDFATWGRYLAASDTLGTFADDLSIPSRFAQLMDPKMGFERANFFFVIPSARASTSTATLREVNRVVDEVASFGRSRFSFIFLETAAKHIRESASEAAESKRVVSLGLSHSSILDAYDRAPRSAKTASGVALLLGTDAFAAAIPCPHAWFNGSASRDDAAIEDRALNPELVRWMKANAFRAVEEITGDTFGILARRGRMIVLATPGAVAESETTKLPVLRGVVQRRNKAGASHFTFGALDGTVYHAWLEQFGITDIDHQLPTVFGLDTDREVVYLVHDEAKLAALRAPSWATGGPQEQIVEELIAGIESRAIEATHYTTMGKIAGFILRLAPFLQPLHRLINGDAEFCAVLFGIVMIFFILTMSLGGASSEEQQPRRPAGIRSDSGPGRKPHSPTQTNPHTPPDATKAKQQ